MSNDTFPSFKFPLLLCGVVPDFLSRASEACVGQDQVQGLGQLGRRLRVLLFLSQRNQEPNPKILEMQEQVTAWFQNGQSHNQASKVSPFYTKTA